MRTGARRKLRGKTRRKQRLRKSINSRLKWPLLEPNKGLRAKMRSNAQPTSIYNLYRRLLKSSSLATQRLVL